MSIIRVDRTPHTPLLGAANAFNCPRSECSSTIGLPDLQIFYGSKASRTTVFQTMYLKPLTSSYCMCPTKSLSDHFRATSNCTALEQRLTSFSPFPTKPVRSCSPSQMHEFLQNSNVRAKGRETVLLILADTNDSKSTALQSSFQSTHIKASLALHFLLLNNLETKVARLRKLSATKASKLLPSAHFNPSVPQPGFFYHSAKSSI